MPETENQQSNLEPHVAATLSYLIPPISGIVFFATEKKNDFVKFHSFQSILFGAAVFVSSKIISILPILKNFIWSVFSIGVFSVWLILMWKAYNKEQFELPFLGKVSKEQLTSKK